MTKSAEALRVEALTAIKQIADLALYSDIPFCSGKAQRAERFIDLAIAQARVEVAEGMHVARCYCHTDKQIDNATTCAMNHRHPHSDPRCSEARNRLRAEVERLANG